jgi:uncharacterized membrane protein YhaH (DUF805 family)
MKWYLQVLRKYAVFTGRAQRKEFWIFGLIHLLIIVLLKGIEVLVKRSHPDSHFALIREFYELAVLIPVIAVTVRRLHDTNRSGWWYFIIFIPLAGIINLMIFMAQDSQPGKNRFGPNPKTNLERGIILQGR